MQAPLRIVLGALLCCCCGAVERFACPEPSPSWRSTQDGGKKASITVVNAAGIPILVKWFNFQGHEADKGHPISIDRDIKIDTFTGHAFRIYSSPTGQAKRALLKEHRVTALEQMVPVTGCSGVVSSHLPGRSPISKRAAEFEQLLLDHHAPCSPAAASGSWSCIKRFTAAEYQTRPRDPHLQTIYGFANKAEAGNRKVTEWVDTSYTSHIPKIPRLTTGIGYLKMRFSDKLKRLLNPWFAKTRKGGPQDAVKKAPVVPGGYTNSKDVPMSKINLDDFRHVQRAVAKEMKDVLEWWTGRRLTHTSTFGARIYHRDAMLINHVDRADTHLASVVIQLDQKTDEDGGWPLEVMDDQGNVHEIYLQANELVLYEGARFRHGRPMRFVGDDFVNIFSHFAPLDWKGPGKSPRYDGLLDEHGFLEGQLADTGGHSNRQDL